jgi:glutathione synthase/RimK-type ligase-like ATP-grasp enzyme
MELPGDSKVESQYRGGRWTAPRPFISLLNEAARQAEVEIRWLSDGWVASLRRAGRICYIHGASFPLNNSGASHIAADKVATFTVLEDAGVPAVPHYLVRFPSSGDTQGAADHALTVVRPPLVVKPLDQAGGLDVCKADTLEEAEKIIGRLAARYYALAVAPFETVLSEHRVVVLDEVPRLFYEKKLPNKDEWRHNLKGGARALLEVSPEKIASLGDIAIRATRAIDGRFMSVDIVRTPEGMKVIEVNSGVALNRFAAVNDDYRRRAVSIYREAITRCFNEGSS